MSPNKETRQIGQWMLDKQLGSGGQGEVWRVRYAVESHSPPCAMKICTDKSKKAKDRFQREIELLRKVSDPGIVRVRDSGEQGGSPYYVMELAQTTFDRVVHGDTAGIRIVRESGILVLTFLRQAGQALARLHEKGVLHRDIKPSNILLMLDPPEPMRAVLCDLGISALEHEQGRLTAAHEVVGTAGFRAPESLLGQHTAASDVYAFGKTIEYAFTGGVPSGIGPGACARSASFSKELWDSLDNLLATACAYNPAHRYKSAVDLMAEFPEPMIVDSRGKHVIQTPPDFTLSSAEIKTLAKIIGECVADSDTVSLREIRSPNRIPPYELSLALRRLCELHLVEVLQEENQDGYFYSAYRPTTAGVHWAQLHREDVANTLGPKPSEPFDDDDIPF